MSRLASKSFNIHGIKTLGIRREQDPDCPYYNRIPIPPLLDAQIDSLWMDKMAVLRNKVLKELRALIVERGQKHWLVIFLTILVLLFNLEFIYQNQHEQTKHYQETVSNMIQFSVRVAKRFLLDLSSANHARFLGGFCKNSDGALPHCMPWHHTSQRKLERRGSECGTSGRPKSSLSNPTEGACAVTG